MCQMFPEAPISRLLLTTTGFLKDIGNLRHGHNFLELLHTDCDGGLVAAAYKDEDSIRNEVF